MTEFYFNGRVFHRPAGGVRRYAHQVATELDYTIVEPPSARFPWSARVWEQTVLAARARSGVLLNVAHSMPRAHRRSVAVIHDLFALTDNDVRRSFQLLMSRQLPQTVAQAAAIVTVSSAVADQIAERFHVDRSTITIAPPGIAEAFSPGDRHAARRRLGLDVDRLTIGALLDPTPRKHSERSVAALKMARSALPDAQIIVGGRDRVGAFATATPRRAKPAGWADVLVNPNDSDLRDLYRASDIVICSSSREGFGLAPVEAAACGAAVVSPVVPSIAEFAPEAAVPVEPIPRKMAEAVIELAMNESLRTQQQLQGPKAVGDLKWRHTAATLDQVCRSVGE